MAKTEYYKFPPKPIDIFKKDDRLKDSSNLAVSALDKQSLRFSEPHQFLKALIIELNKKLRTKPASEIAGIINYWLTQDYFDARRKAFDREPRIRLD